MTSLFTPEKTLKFKRLSSTNYHLRKILAQTELDEGVMITTLYQTSGRGQYGNSWHSVEGKNLLLSFLLRPTFLKPSQIFLVNMSVCLALLHTVKPFHRDFTIKWPNDILWRSLKVAGILIENSFSGNCIETTVIGVGVNVNQTDFAPSLKAGSLKAITGKEHSIESLRLSFANNMEHYYFLLQRNPHLLKQEYLHHLYGFRQMVPVKCNGVLQQGAITAVHENGQIEMNLNQRENSTFHFKEIEFYRGS